MKKREDIKNKFKLVSKKWNKQRIIIRALFPLFLCLSLGLMIGGFNILVPELSYDDAFENWAPGISKAEKDNLSKSIGYYGKVGEDDVDVSNIAPVSFLYEFVDNMVITNDMLENLQVGGEIQKLYGNSVYATEEFVSAILKYITIVNSEDSNFIAKLTDSQSKEGYIWFTNEITSEDRFIKRDNFVVKTGIESLDLVDYIESFQQEDYPTLKELSTFTKKRSDIEDFETSVFTSIANAPANYQFAAFSVLKLGIEEHEENQNQRDLSIGLGMAGTFLLFACFNYLAWVYFEVNKKRHPKTKEV